MLVLLNHIAFINYDISAVGGVEKVTEILANQLSHYYKVYIISLCKSNKDIPYKFNSNIEIIFINCFRARVRDILLKNRKKMKAILKKSDISTCLLMGGNVGFILGFWNLDKKINKIFCDHGALSNQINNKVATFYRRIAYGKTNITVTLTEKNKDDYCRYFKADKTKIITIYNPIERPLNCSQEYNPYSNSIISVGRLSKEKGYDLLLEVAQELKKINTDWTWDIWGDGEEYQWISQKIVEMDLREHVFLKGYNDSINSIYKNYSMFVLTSYREGLPLVLLEAKFNKLPIVSFDIDTGPREIIRESVNGFLIKPYDTKEMANKINLLLSNSSLKEEFSKNSYYDIKKFELEEIIRKWRILIDNYQNNR